MPSDSMKKIKRRCFVSNKITQTRCYRVVAQFKPKFQRYTKLGNMPLPTITS